MTDLLDPNLPADPFVAPVDPLPPTRQSTVAVVGAGYVGLPLALAFARNGARVLCLDPDAHRVESLRRGVSYIQDVSSEELGVVVAGGALEASSDFGRVAEADEIVVCVPTPLTRNREPDLAYIRTAAASIAPHLRHGQLVVLESTTYPGTTTEVLQPILERVSGLRAGVDFHLAYSPERIDPGRTDYTVRTTPKVVGGLTAACTERACALYGPAVDELVRVSSPAAAEMTKLLENIFRSVNIAFMNEMAMLCDRLGLDVWEVADAAATKPFGFMPFLPGPGLGGHCLPLDPFYLAWKAREVDFYTEFIELAGKVNQNMPHFCLQKLQRALNADARSLRGARVLVLGVAYKPDIDDVRESPALKLMELLRAEGADVRYHDPFVAELPRLGLSSSPLHSGLAEADCVAILTAHRGVDYAEVVERAPLVVDFRNATRGLHGGRVVRL